jgi:predicted  nucleic acid-binding Zn-ribbon protein
MIASILAFLKTAYEKRILIASGTFALVVIAFYVYHKTTQARIENLLRENGRLEVIVQQQKTAIEQIQKDYKSVIESKDELSKQIENTQTEVQELREKLFRENLGKKPLEELATKKTTLIEKKINKATEEVLKCFELLSQGGDC